VLENEGDHFNAVSISCRFRANPLGTLGIATVRELPQRFGTTSVKTYWKRPR